MFICVYFDGTMVDHMYPIVGNSVPGAASWCRIFQRHGAEIILWTMRSNDTLKDAVDYMNANDIKLYGVNDNPTQNSWTTSRKVYAPIYIDDAAVGCPLIQIPGFARRCVDWNDVGHFVMNQLTEK